MAENLYIITIIYYILIYEPVYIFIFVYSNTPLNQLRFKDPISAMNLPIKI